MATAGDSGAPGLRVAVVGTGTEIGKTHVSCALLTYWSVRSRVVGLKPIETGVAPEADGSRRAISNSASLSDQEKLARAAGSFHVKRRADRTLAPRGSFHVKQTSAHGRPTAVSSIRGGATGAAKDDHRKRPPVGAPGSPLRSLFAFPDPVSPHLAARDAGVRIDLGTIERWVAEHEAPITLIETAGALFSPIGYGTTNFDLVQSLRPDAVLLVAPDRLGVLHDLTTTLALAAARGGPPLGIVLSAPARTDTSTGRNAGEIEALGIGHVVSDFPRARVDAPATIRAAERVDAWVKRVPRP